MNIEITFVNENNTPVSIKFENIHNVSNKSEDHYLLGVDFMSSKWDTIVATGFTVRNCDENITPSYYNYDCGYLTQSYADNRNYATEDFYPILTIKNANEVVDVIKFDKISNCKQDDDLISPPNSYGVEKISFKKNKDLFVLNNIIINKSHLDKYLDIEDNAMI